MKRALVLLLAACTAAPACTWTPIVAQRKVLVTPDRRVHLHNTLLEPTPYDRGLDDDVTLVGGAQVPLRSLLGECAAAAGGSDCVLTGERAVVLGHDLGMTETASNVLAAGAGVLMLGAIVGGLGYCTFECSSPGNYISGITLGTMVVGGVALGLLIDALAHNH